MAFYISQPKVRQSGFELPNKQDEERQPSPTYDPSMYFAHNNFGSPFDAFSNRLKYPDNHANVDFTDTLASMISESDARNAANGTPHPAFHAGQPQPNPFDPHQFPHASSGHPILSPTGSAFSPAHGFPASAPASHPSFFDGADYAFLRGGTDRADTPSLASPTTADSPFSTTAPPLASTAPSKRGSGSAASRSRSRGPAAASTSRSRARKRASISSPSPPPASALIPSQNAWYIPTHGSHNDTPSSFGFASSLAMGAGASPKSLGAKVSMAEDLAAKQAQLLSEKRRRRRESHNAVERRRRDNINEKISELSTLIPDELSNQIIATIENRPEMGESPSGDEDEESILDEDERGRQSARRGRFRRGISVSVGKSERVDEVDESALSDGSGKMED
ncbi:hypothetical protein FRC11_005212 [Ceratobasidium sp. 423]|nr:hypothetical protein FRC11_005212 [Ceratobasidium sp. 423]